jgi:flagellum-specific ATP synthase
VCLVGSKKIPCEVVSLKGPNVYLMPLYDLDELMIRDKVYLSENQMVLPNVNYLLGRTINAMGEFIDDKEILEHIKREKIKLNKKAPDAMTRTRIQKVLSTGIKAIDSMLTIGEGQKIGIFAGTGVGKSTLLGMIARNAKADINVIALVGERGREVLEFIENDLGEEGMKRSVLVISTSDEQPLMHIKAAQLATSIAEEFRDQGKNVLLMMDSITRFALARKKIDNASGFPTIQGRTPSMEPYLQKLLERSGTNKQGSITGIYTVLVEGDDFIGAIPDMARGILDGHIILDRQLAEMNHFPAINILNSISRVMDKIVEKEHWDYAREIKKYLSIYKENEDNFNLGMYVPGQNKEIDIAKLIVPKINDFLKQDIAEAYDFQYILSLMRGIGQ